MSLPIPVKARKNRMPGDGMRLACPLCQSSGSPYNQVDCADISKLCEHLRNSHGPKPSAGPSSPKTMSPDARSNPVPRLDSEQLKRLQQMMKKLHKSSVEDKYRGICDILFPNITLPNSLPLYAPTIPDLRAAAATRPQAVLDVIKEGANSGLAWFAELDEGQKEGEVHKVMDMMPFCVDALARIGWTARGPLHYPVWGPANTWTSMVNDEATFRPNTRQSDDYLIPSISMAEGAELSQAFTEPKVAIDPRLLTGTYGEDLTPSSGDSSSGLGPYIPSEEESICFAD